MAADIKTLRGLSHPVRMALVDALLLGPLSATEAGEAIGESATTCSFHLRQLAKYGMVEVHETGPGRRRTWKLIEKRWRVPSAVLRDESDPVGMYEAVLDRFLEQARSAVLSLAYIDSSWDEASTTSRSPFYLTKQELADFSAHLTRLVQAYKSKVGERTQNPELRPRGSRPIEVILFAVPAAEEPSE